MTSITARTTFEGLHRWPDAPDRRAYLRTLHRHLFVVAATVAVGHDEREVEFHDLADEVRHTLRRLSEPFHAAAQIRTFGAASCETIATRVAEALDALGYLVLKVVVSEDGENDSTWEVEA